MFPICLIAAGLVVTGSPETKRTVQRHIRNVEQQEAEARANQLMVKLIDDSLGEVIAQERDAFDLEAFCLIALAAARQQDDPNGVAQLESAIESIRTIRRKMAAVRESLEREKAEVGKAKGK